ncbi:DUF2934 domain-containing protein [Bradyrhizobium canariense]|uniref:DUF2934 domain-containing protein n=1 Tax=Bradyrhizobium canariense TaxID=255045 RepID=UPI001C66C7B5|nr:DUF2934 domain-containing protein [Bradyrhizobium canariense]MBW5434538.1 DUF2934 domain-containing protein [Bradyrhizobium canariense]
MSDLEQNIRERAYQLWVQSGYSHGQAEAHWLTAQREVLASSLGAVARVTPAVATKTKSGKSRKKRAA